MNFMFEWREHKIHIFELTCNVLFTILTYWWWRFWWFSEDCRPLSKDIRRFSKIVPKARKTFLNIFRKFCENVRRCPRIAEDCRRLPKTEEDPKMFRWYTNESKYNLIDKLDINENIDIFTCEDIIFTCEAILSFLSICYHSVYHWLLKNKTFLTYNEAL